MSYDAARRAAIARLNDHFCFTGEAGMDDAFTPENDPYGKHDFGALVAERHRIAWKISYYQRDLSNARSDPVDPATTKHVMSIMLAEEY